MWQLLGIVALTGIAASPKPLKQPEAPAVSFAGLGKPRSRLLWYVAISIALHGVLVVASVIVAESIGPARSAGVPDLVTLSNGKTYLVIRLPQRSYYPARLAREADLQAGSPDRRPVAPSGVPGQGARNDRPPAARAAGPLLLQPSKPLTSKVPPMELPAFLHWAPGKPTTPAPAQAGTLKPLLAAVLANAEPSLQPPNEEAFRAALSLIRSVATSNVNVSPSSTTPVRSASKQTVTASQTAGQPVAAVSVSPKLPDNSQLVKLPQVTMTGGEGRATGSGAASSARTDGSGPGLPSERGGKLETSVTQTSLAVARAGSSDPATAGTRPQSSGAATAPGVQVLQTAAGPVEVRQFPDGSRALDYPDNGQFDVVILQAAAGNIIPEAGRLLTGKPVQSGYITVGGSRDWVLHYCTPGASGGVNQAGMVVSLGGPSELRAPWIRRAALPPVRSASGKAAVFYGVLGSDGRLQRMRVISGPAYQNRTDLLPYFDRWQFSPASRDGAPTEVEVLLIAPGEAL